MAGCFSPGCQPEKGGQKAHHSDGMVCLANISELVFQATADHHVCTVSKYYLACLCDRLKDKTFGACFWQSVSSIVQVNSKSKEMRWKTTKQLEDVFGEEAETMKASLPQRRHPKNARVHVHVCQPAITMQLIFSNCFHSFVCQVCQWLLEDDFSTMSILKQKTNSVSNASKLSQAQAEGLDDAMDFNLDDNAFEGLQHGFSDHAKHLQACHHHWLQMDCMYACIANKCVVIFLVILTPIVRMQILTPLSCQSKRSSRALLTTRMQFLMLGPLKRDLWRQSSSCRRMTMGTRR